MRQITFETRRNGRNEVSKIITNFAHFVIYLTSSRNENVIDLLSESKELTPKERISILIDNEYFK